MRHNMPDFPWGHVNEEVRKMSSESESKSDPDPHITPNEKTNSSKRGNYNLEEDYGYFFYPERKEKLEDSWFSKILTHGRRPGRHLMCVTNVYACGKKNPLVKLLLGALKSHGCPVDFSRNFSCEECRSGVNGGYDPSTNQVVVCQNNSKPQNIVCSVVAHELTHMFDFCRAKVDFSNLEHLACTEIRAAQFHHCSFMSSWFQGDVSIMNFSKKHQECVKRKALMSILTVRNIGMDEGKKVVDKVFDRCYNDLEPFGRIPRRKSRDPERMLQEGRYFGYSS